MKSFIVAMVVVVTSLFVAGTASAQTYYPGSIWTSNGRLDPAEKGNVVSFTHIEQGIARSGVELFGQTTLVTASQQNDWEHRAEVGIGGRFTQTLPKGMLRASVSYVRDNRFLSNTAYTGVVVAVEAWFGWSQAPKPLTKPLRP